MNDLKKITKKGTKSKKNILANSGSKTKIKREITINIRSKKFNCWLWKINDSTWH